MASKAVTMRAILLLLPAYKTQETLSFSSNRDTSLIEVLTDPSASTMDTRIPPVGRYTNMIRFRVYEGVS